jgi:dipeptidyl aminopeptidase/acylaminoacyl peptidase
MRHFVCAAALALLPALTVIHAQEKVVATPPSITTEGIPPIPQSIADGLARYAQFRQAQLMAWHPTKRQILITTALGNAPQLYAVDGPLRYRRQLTWLDRSLPPLANVAFDPADPNAFVYQYDPEGGELRSLYRYDLATGESSLVTASKTRYPHLFARDGKWVAFDSAERNGRDRDLYVMLVSDPATKRRIIEAEGAWSPQDWSPDGSSILVNEVFGNAETYVWRVDVKSGQRTALTPRDAEKAAWYNPRFSADGRRVYVISDRQGGDFRLWRCDVANCKWTSVTPDGLAVDALGGPHGSAGFEFSPDGTQIAVVIDKGTSTELQLIDVTTMKPRTFAAIPRGLVSQLHWRPGSREIGFTLGSIKAQGDVYSLDTSLGTVTRWTSSEASFNPDVLPAPEVVEWKSADGMTISGVLYRPSSRFNGPRPVLVNIHGGPDTSERVRWQGRSNYFLNEMGVAIVFPNVRGSSGFGRKFQQMDDGRGREGAIRDIGALLDWIGTRQDLDRDRVMLLGGSYGGWLAIEAGIHYNDRIRGIIAGAAITDFVTYLESTDPARQVNRRLEFGDERDPQTREFLKSISPVTRAAELKKPTFILHPGKDIRVPVGQARELRDALKKNNAPVWYAEFPNASHDPFPSTGTEYNWMMAGWIAFVQQYLLN